MEAAVIYRQLFDHQNDHTEYKPQNISRLFGEKIKNCLNVYTLNLR